MLITAAQPRVVFPRDEGSHPTAKTEWWYLNGHLEDEDGNKYGFHHALFDAPDVVDARYNVDMPAMPGAMMLDTALTEEATGEHTYSRDMKILRPYANHTDVKTDELNAGYDQSFRLQRWDTETIHVRGLAGRAIMDVDMKATKPPILMGGEGEIEMGPNGLSKYYTFPKLEVTGTLLIDGEEKNVKGSAWMDHQWGDMAIFNGYKGWDWFGIQLSNDTQINAFRFRDEQGGNVQTTVGISNPDGSQSDSEQMKLTPGRTWRSPETGAEYPVEWHLSVPDQQIELDLRPTVDDQEMVGHPPHCYPELAPKPTYWEGSMQVTGSVKGQPVDGRAYLELVGYPGDRILVTAPTQETIDLAKSLQRD